MGDEALKALFAPITARFGEMVQLDADGSLAIPVRARPLTRMIARMLDAYEMEKSGHSPAI